MLRVASVIQPWFPVLLLTSCVTLGNLFRFSGPWFYYWRISRDDFYPAGCRAGETQECTRTTRHIVGSQCTVTESATASRFLSPGQFENYLHYLSHDLPSWPHCRQNQAFPSRNQRHLLKGEARNFNNEDSWTLLWLFPPPF